MTSSHDTTSRLAALLLESECISNEDLRTALGARDQCHLVERLVASGAIEESKVVSELAKHTGRPRVSLDEATPEEKALASVSGHLCAQFMVLPIEISNTPTGNHLVVAMADPLDVDAIRALHGEADMRISPLIARASAVRRAIERCYGISSPIPEKTTAAEESFDTIRPQVFDDLFDELDESFGLLFEDHASITTEAEAYELLQSALKRSSKIRDQLLISLILSLADSGVISTQVLLSRLRDPNDVTREESPES